MTKKTIRSISVFGDSILRGIVLNEHTKRYSIDNSIDMDGIANMYSMEVRNHSRFGCTIERAYEYVNKYLARDTCADVVLLELGGNDCDFNWKQIAACPDDFHQPNTPIERFVNVYNSLIEKLREHNITPVLSNLPPPVPRTVS